MVKRICLWSGPRNVSTALMYSFSQRADTCVLDEPLYAHYLRVSKAPHPGAKEVLAVMENDGHRVVEQVILGNCDRPVLFMKQMAHHLVEIDRTFMAKVFNVLLIRDPADVLRSLVNQIPVPVIKDVGIADQYQLLKELEAFGQKPPVIDAKELLQDPSDVLSQLCQRIGVPFEDSMLSWPVGGCYADGIWAKYWYHNVHKSSGFQPYKEKSEPFPDRLLALLEECRPYYQELYSLAIRASI